MINQETVLILGAGASMHLNYPSGKKLKNEIVTGLAKDSPMFEALYEILQDVRPLVALRDGLKLSGLQSIDEFLEHRPELIPAGKLAIAYDLIPREYENELFKDEDNWYYHLFKNLNTSFESFAENKLTVITFNYDRSLEQYLFIALKNAYGKDENDVSKVLSKLNFVHVHGQLGYLPWQKIEGARAYNSTLDRNYIESSSKQIKIIHDDMEQSAEFANAKKAISLAKRIVFLGFGYHHKNMDRLGMNELELKTVPIGSSCGITELEANDLQKTYGARRLKLPDRNDMNVLTFMRNHVSFR